MGGIIMKYGKIRIEDGNLVFARHMMMNYLPCRDILWVYKRQEGVEGGAQKQISTSYLVVVTILTLWWAFRKEAGSTCRVFRIPETWER